MDTEKTKQEFIDTLSDEEKIAIAISVIDKRIEELKEEKEKTRYNLQLFQMHNQMIYELSSARDMLKE